MTEQEKAALQLRLNGAVGRGNGEGLEVALKRASRRNAKSKILCRRVRHAQQAIDEGRDVGWERMKKALDGYDGGLGDGPRGRQ